MQPLKNPPKFFFAFCSLNVAECGEARNPQFDPARISLKA
jgi:hypothetical protein